MKTGIILINLGTPDGPTTPEVRRYLQEFLMDPFVVDIPWLARVALVYGIISPFRSPKSAHAYQTIWRENDEGSPLKYYHLRLVERVQALMPEMPVVAGMRYGNPSLQSALQELKTRNVERVLAFPLYPQYAYASTTSSIERTKLEALRLGLKVEFIEDFYKDAEFLNAEVAVAKEALGSDHFDHYLMSFHGVPERQVKKVAGEQCLTTNCCDQITERNRYCYRAQCFATAHEMAKLLGLSRSQYSISFQSRLGRTPWIQPFTDHEYERLARSGVKRLAVFCPSFVADCLETLEEIEMRGREQFRALGGEDLKLIPSLNDHPRWVEAVTRMVRGKLGELS